MWNDLSSSQDRLSMPGASPRTLPAPDCFKSIELCHVDKVQGTRNPEIW